MADDVVALMRQWKRDLLLKEQAQMEAMAGRWLMVENRLSADIELLARQLAEKAANGEIISQATLFRMERYQALMAQVQSEWAAYANYAANTIENAQLEWGQLGISHAAGAIEAVAGVGTSFYVLPIDAVVGMAGLLGDGSPLLATLAARANSIEMINKLANALLNGTALGWNPRKTARAMKDGLTGGLNKALTIARTEQMRVYRDMNRRQMQASRVCEGYYRIATRDERTCAACLARDGEFFDLDTPMDEHPQGRCGQVPAVVGFEPPQWLKGPDWFESQDAATQRGILGKERFELWQEGAFDFSDLATTRSDGVWGDSLQVTPVAELAGG